MIQALTQRINIVGNARERIAHRILIEEPEWHPVDFLGDILAQLEAHALRHARHNPALHKRANRRERIKPERSKKNARDDFEINAARAIHFRNQAVEKLGRSL